MAAIGGIFNADGAACDTDALVRMSKAMLRRGSKEREGEVFEGGGLFWSLNSADGEMSATAKRGDVTALCDGDAYTEGESGGVRARFFGEEDVTLCLEGYLKYGNDFGRRFSGEYAFAAYDRDKKELLLYRSGEGGRPLYYAKKGNSYGFSSEIKGILAFLGEAPSVDRTRLRAHVLSRGGQYSGADLYRDVYEVSASGGCVCSRLGMSEFECRGAVTPNEEWTGRRIKGDLACPDEEGMARLLSETLYAFDYPQFDCLMPSFIRDLQSAKEGGGAVVDGSLCCDIGYSYERQDRLSTLVGVRAPCLPPRTCTVKERELRKMEKIMKSLYVGQDRTEIEYIFGKNIEGDIEKEGNTARRIRALGMVTQTVTWYNNYRIMLV